MKVIIGNWRLRSRKWPYGFMGVFAYNERDLKFAYNQDSFDKNFEAWMQGNEDKYELFWQIKER